MKASALICKLTNGTLVPFVSESVRPLEEMAKAIRVSGQVEVGGELQPVDRGLVLSPNAIGPVYQFVVRQAPTPVAEPEPVADEAPTPKPRARKG